MAIIESEVGQQAFIQAPEHRPNLSNTAEARGVPVINLSGASNSDDHELVREIGSACREWGFFQVINHGVAPEKLLRVETVAREFFALAEEEKRAVRKDEARMFGYYEAEHTKNVRDWKEVFDFTVEDPTFVPASSYAFDYDDDNDEIDKQVTVLEWTNQWPERPAKLREACEEYAQEMQKLCNKLLELIARSLGLEANRFNGFFKDQTSYVRMNYYPACPIPHLALGIARHKDSGALTILAQDDVGGLQVKRKTDGEWINVKPTPDAFIVNIGDVLQVWSNEIYESVEHRVVVNSKKERFSIPFFLFPSHYTMVKPLEELTSENNPAKYRTYNWGKYYTTRRASNFKKLAVENIQIHHFKLSAQPEQT